MSDTKMSEREQFEAWYCANYGWYRDRCARHDDENDCDYKSGEVNDFWGVWQARAALQSQPVDVVPDLLLRCWVADLIHVSSFAINMSPHISEADLKIAQDRIAAIKEILTPAIKG